MKIIATCFFILGLSLSSFAQSLEKICPGLNQPPCSNAKAQLESAWAIVTGETLETDGWKIDAERMMQYGVVTEEKFKDGIKLTDAVNYYKLYVSTLSPGHGAKLVQRAFLEVYGRLPDAAEQGLWFAKVKNKTAWYTTIVSAEIDNLNKKFERLPMIIRAYQNVMVRKPTEEEAKYWMARTEHYRLIRDGNRNWLYSSKGVKDLRQTVRAVLSAKYQNEPPQAEIDAAIKIFTPLKLIYLEMIDYSKACGSKCGF